MFEKSRGFVISILFAVMIKWYKICIKGPTVYHNYAYYTNAVSTGIYVLLENKRAFVGNKCMYFV